MKGGIKDTIIVMDIRESIRVESSSEDICDHGSEKTDHLRVLYSKGLKRSS